MGIAENLKSIREQHGLTQQQFGEIAGVSDKAVSTWELGVKIPRMKCLEKISTHFNISKSKLIDDDYVNKKAFLDLGKLIRRKKNELGFTDKDIAKAVGVSELMISNWQKGNFE